MAKLKIGKAEDLDARIEDPVVLREAFQQLFDAETEFPIRVEGTHTLPYFSTIKSFHWQEGFIILKLVRPLPHELLLGAVFHMLFAVGEQRYEGFLDFAGREGYLQYKFELPKHLVLSDRRVHKRYPFRPRESAYVILQDASIPGLGVAGPLVNICMGGLALRVDRIIKLDTGVRIPPSTALFDRGKSFPRIRVQDLPRVHFMEVRGLTAHALERGAELVLGVTFTALQAEEEALLHSALDIRDRMQRGQYASRLEGGPVPLKDPDGHTPLPGEPGEETAAGNLGAALLGKLRRRTASLAVVMAPGPEREALEAQLRQAGYHRLQVAGTLEQLRALVDAEPRRHPPRLVLVDLSVAHAGDAEPLEAVRSIEKGVAGIGSLPTVILCDAVDPTLLLSQADQTRFIPTGLPREAIATLDAMLDQDAGV